MLSVITSGRWSFDMTMSIEGVVVASHKQQKEDDSSSDFRTSTTLPTERTRTFTALVRILSHKYSFQNKSVKSLEFTHISQYLECFVLSQSVSLFRTLRLFAAILRYLRRIIRILRARFIGS